MKDRILFQQYVSDMLAVERHLLPAFENQSKDERYARHPQTRRLVNKIEATIRSHINGLEQHLSHLGGDAASLSRLFMPFGAGEGGEDGEEAQASMAAAGDILQRHAGEITVKSSPSWKTILAISFPVASDRDRRKVRRDRRRTRPDRRSAG